MVVLQAEFNPPIEKELNELMKADKTLMLQINSALKDASLEYNKNIKLANPQKTGTSRRGWGNPIQVSPMTWVVYNNVNYVPYIKYGQKSKFVQAPEGVTINPGKPFTEVVEDYFEIVIDKLEKRINYIMTGFWQ